MKNKSIVLIISFLLLTLSGQAQRRLPGQQSLQATIGTVNGLGNNTLHCGFAFSQFNKNQNRWTFGAEYLLKKLEYRIQTISIEQFTGEGGYFYTFLSDGSKTFFFTAGVSGMAGYEQVNRGKSILYDGSTLLSKSKFLFGGAFSFEVEAYVIDRVILLANFRQRILPASTVNRFNSQFGMGIKFIIN